MKALQRHGLPVAFVLLWSSAYIAGAVAVPAAAPLAVTLYRFAIAGGLLAVLAWIRRERWPSRGRELGAAMATGVLLFAVQFGGLYLGLAAHMPAATSALVTCSAPLFVATASALLGWETLTARRWVGVGLGLVGVIVTLSDRLGRPPSLAALGWTLAALIGLAGGTLFQGRMAFSAGEAATASVELLASAAVMACIAPFTGSLAIPTTTSVVIAFLFITVVAGIGAPLLLFALIRTRGATGASSLLFVVPPLAALEGWLVLDSRMGPAAILGLSISALGLWLGRAPRAAGAQATECAAECRSLRGGGSTPARR